MCFSTFARRSTRVFSSVVQQRGVSGLERMLATWCIVRCPPGALLVVIRCFCVRSERHNEAREQARLLGEERVGSVIRSCGFDPHVEHRLLGDNALAFLGLTGL